MKHPVKQRWRKGVAAVAALRIAGNIDARPGNSRKGLDAAADLIRRKEARCLVPCTGSTECKLDGRTINARRFGRLDAFTRQVVQLSGPVSIVTLIPMLP